MNYKDIISVNNLLYYMLIKPPTHNRNQYLY